MVLNYSKELFQSIQSASSYVMYYFFLVCLLVILNDCFILCDRDISYFQSTEKVDCDGDMEKCFCTTKGTIGNQCDECDIINNYHFLNLNKICVYELITDFQYTFNLSKETDQHFTRIIYTNSPMKPDTDVKFHLVCSELAQVNITVRHENEDERLLHENYNCSMKPMVFSFLDTQYHFGKMNATEQTTFFVYVYNFKTPLWVQIFFAQPPKLNLPNLISAFARVG